MGERVTPEQAPPTRSSERNEIVAAGSLIDGKYRVLREIGSGGMGQVFAAVHVELGHTVAIKVMHDASGPDTDAGRRFVREGRAAALLKSDHAVRINDVGRFPSGRPYLVMEYLEGEDLERLRARHVPPIEDVVDYMLQALSALAEAHDAGLVHRDIKPQNLFLARLTDGKLRVKVLDFGLAKELPSVDHDASELTSEHMMLGTPNFMSPEQIRNSISVDARTDIWAIGATMFSLLTGRAPYTSSTTHGLLARILSDPPPRARELRSDVPEALDDVIQRCMTKDLFARFQSASDLAAALRAATLSPSTVSDDAPRTVQESRPDDDDEEAVPTGPSLLEDAVPATVVAPGALPETRRLPLSPSGSKPTVTHRIPTVPATMPTRTLPMPRVTSELESAATARAPGAPPAAVAVGTPSSDERIAAAAAVSSNAASAQTAPTMRPLERAPSTSRKARRSWLPVVLIVALAAVIVGVLSARAARVHDRPQPGNSGGEGSSRTPPTDRSAPP